MPKDVDECVKSVMEDNPDYSESRAYAVCWAQKNEGNLAADKDTVVEVAVQNNLSAEAANTILSNDNVSLEDDPCWEGYTMVGQKIDENGNEVPNCVPDDDVPDANMASGECPEGEVKVNGECVDSESVDAPPSILNGKMLAVGQSLDSQPIKREELSGDKVAYRNIKLLDTGVWTDQNSQTPTLYDETTFSNLEAVSGDTTEGPPTNIAHDVHKRGANKGEPHEASVGGYVDPESLSTDGEALFGDFIFDLSKPAGDFADANLKSALENDGTAGFSPSVELEPVEMAETVNHPHAQEHVKSARLTGVGLVRDPASETVDLMQETQERAVALSADSPKGKTIAMQKAGMTDKQLMDVDDVRETLDKFGFDGLDEMTDDEVADMAEDLHGDLMEQVQEDDDMGNDMADGEDMDEDDDDEEEEDMDMEDGSDDMDALQSQVATLSERLEEVEDAIAQAMADEGGLAASSDVEEVESELAALKPDGMGTDEVRRTLASIGTESKESRTLAEGATDEEEWDYADADDGVTYGPNGTISR